MALPLVSAQLGAAGASDDLISFVHSPAQGNPFFTEELLAALMEQGALSGDSLRLVKRPGELELPRSVLSLIGERISRLPLRSHELLRLASLLGEEFELDVLLAVTWSSWPNPATTTGMMIWGCPVATSVAVYGQPLVNPDSKVLSQKMRPRPNSRCVRRLDLK